MLKGFTHARLACGCRIAFRDGVEGSSVTVVVDEKGTCCVISLHVRDIVLPAGLEVLSDEDATICAVIAPRAVVEATPEGEGAAEPELIRKTKEEEEAK